MCKHFNIITINVVVVVIIIMYRSILRKPQCHSTDLGFTNQWNEWMIFIQVTLTKYLVSWIDGRNEWYSPKSLYSPWFSKSMEWMNDIPPVHSTVLGFLNPWNEWMILPIVHWYNVTPQPLVSWINRINELYSSTCHHFRQDVLLQFINNSSLASYTWGERRGHFINVVFTTRPLARRHSFIKTVQENIIRQRSPLLARWAWTPAPCPSRR